MQSQIITVVLLTLTQQNKSPKAYTVCVDVNASIPSRHYYPECKESPFLEGNTGTGEHMAAVAAVHEGHR